MDLVRLRHALAVAETGSFSRAAAEQNLSQPALSRSIAAIEARYGVRLFERRRSGVMATSAGIQVIEQARAIVAAADELERNLRLYGKAEAGRISIGLGSTLASLLLPGLSQSLLMARPNLQIQTMVKPPAQLVSDLMNNSIEMIIGSNVLIEEFSGLNVDKIGVLDLVLVVRGSHPLAGRSGLTLADLAEFPTAKPMGFPSGPSKSTSGAFICDNFHILRETVIGTNCISLFAAAFVAEELRDGRMVVLDVMDYRVVKNEVCVISKAGRKEDSLSCLVKETAKTMIDRACFVPM